MLHVLLQPQPILAYLQGSASNACWGHCPLFVGTDCHTLLLDVIARIYSIMLFHLSKHMRNRRNAKLLPSNLLCSALTFNVVHTHDH